MKTAITSSLLIIFSLALEANVSVIAQKIESKPGTDAELMASEILMAVDTRRQIPFLSLTFGPFDIDEAYTIQSFVDEALAERLGPAVGYKVAYASRSAQEQFGVDEPARGTYFLAHATPNGSTIRQSHFMEIMVETEVAFTIGQTVWRQMGSVDELKKHVRWIHPALDLGDFRYSRDEGKPTVADMIACGTGAHGFVLGPGKDPASIEAGNLDLLLVRNGETLRESKSSAVMDNPWNSLLWCVNDIIARGGIIKRGTVILTGTAAPAYMATGEAITGTYTGDCGHLGSVTLNIE
ncbi:MAG: 2-keto-4-pentenoate hydratase [Puniceicoccaceae bacterium]